MQNVSPHPCFKGPDVTPEPVSDAIGLRAPVEPLSDRPHGRGSRDVPQSHRPSPGELAGKDVLDAGCGMGRYLRIAAESPARLIVGIDLSLAVAAARELTSGVACTAIVRGDLLRLPFAPGSFDAIYSLGVLDHTPDPRAAFLSLARLLKPGGRIAIWVYPGSAGSWRRSWISSGPFQPGCRWVFWSHSAGSRHRSAAGSDG